MPSEFAKCSELFEELETQRIELLAELQQWPVEGLRFRPQAGAWSAVEVLDHVVRAEAGIIANLLGGLEQLHVLGDEERPRIAELERALRSDQRFQVPPGAAAIHPDAQATLPEVAARWEQARAELRSILGTLAPEHASCGVFCHPFAGWMTVADVLRHFSAHLYHHGYQLERLRAGFAAESRTD